MIERVRSAASLGEFFAVVGWPRVGLDWLRARMRRAWATELIDVDGDQARWVIAIAAGAEGI
jgi:hypothetical protein